MLEKEDAQDEPHHRRGWKDDSLEHQLQVGQRQEKNKTGKSNRQQDSNRPIHDASAAGFAGGFGAFAVSAASASFACRT